MHFDGMKLKVRTVNKRGLLTALGPYYPTLWVPTSVWHLLTLLLLPLITGQEADLSLRPEQLSLHCHS